MINRRQWDMRLIIMIWNAWRQFLHYQEWTLPVVYVLSSPPLSPFPLHLIHHSYFYFFLSSPTLNTLAQYGNGIIKLSTECKYFEGRRGILAQYGNGIIKLSTESKYLKGRRRILAQYGNGIIQLSTESKYFWGKNENACTI